jgi:hypothetical protein
MIDSSILSLRHHTLLRRAPRVPTSQKVLKNSFARVGCQSVSATETESMLSHRHQPASSAVSDAAHNDGIRQTGAVNSSLTRCSTRKTRNQNPAGLR